MVFGISRGASSPDPQSPLAPPFFWARIATALNTNLLKWLSEILAPVLKLYSSYYVKDSFLFANFIQNCNLESPKISLCSFHISSLFTNVPLDETTGICANALYRGDLDYFSIITNFSRILWCIVFLMNWLRIFSTSIVWSRIIPTDSSANCSLFLNLNPNYTHNCIQPILLRMTYKKHYLNNNYSNNYNNNHITETSYWWLIDGIFR